MFSGEGSHISSHIVKVIESCQERLLISTQNISDASIIDAIANAVIDRGANVYLLVDTQGFESIYRIIFANNFWVKFCLEKGKIED